MSLYLYPSRYYFWYKASMTYLRMIITWRWFVNGDSVLSKWFILTYIEVDIGFGNWWGLVTFRDLLFMSLWFTSKLLLNLGDYDALALGIHRDMSGFEFPVVDPGRIIWCNGPSVSLIRWDSLQVRIIL